MANIGQQIGAARKARGMTQEELSKALNVSRTTVSNWEIGRRLPDAETLLKLSAVLNYSFEEAERAADTVPGKAEPEAEEPVAPDGAAAPQADLPSPPTDAGPGKRRRRVIVAIAAAAVCAALLIAFALHRKPVAVPPTSEAVEASSVTKEFFLQNNPTVDGQTCFLMDCTLQTIKSDGMDVWMYHLSMHEKRGLAFAVDKLETYTFVNNSVDARTYSAELLAEVGLPADCPAYGDWDCDGGLPVQDSVSGIGFIIRGKYETGEALSFVFYQPLASK